MALEDDQIPDSSVGVRTAVQPINIMVQKVCIRQIYFEMVLHIHIWN
jgi:hypothetical protein